MSWNIDASHTHVGFSVRHMMVSNVRGQFDNFSGVINFDEQYPAASSVDVQIEAASINTKFADRDAHLRSPDFLDAEQYPYITFKSKRVQPLDNRRGKLVGDLTIRDITKEVTLDVTHQGTVKAPFGNFASAGFSAETTINREEWGLTWNAALEAGGILVGNDVKISIELELVKNLDAELEAAAA
jgi:polyisoprenoid-binding protein YceI